MNTLLAATETQVKRQYVTGWLRALDRLVHRFDRIDDIVAMWDVGRARDAAWTNGEALWAIRDDAELAQAYLDSLDRMVGFAGRGLLVPADTWLQRLGRASLVRRRLCFVAIGPSGPPTAFDHISWIGTFVLLPAILTSFMISPRFDPASSIGMSPISPPLCEYQPMNLSAAGVSPAAIASSMSGSVRASQSSW